jgi:hypothetical protein
MRYRTFEVAIGRFNGSFSNSHFFPLITSHHRFQSHPSPSKPLAADRVDLATHIIPSHYLQPHPLFCLHFPVVSPHSAAASDHLKILTTKLCRCVFLRVLTNPHLLPLLSFQRIHLLHLQLLSLQIHQCGKTSCRLKKTQLHNGLAVRKRLLLLLPRASAPILHLQKGLMR